jgi:hypothetical protein
MQLRVSRDYAVVDYLTMGEFIGFRHRCVDPKRVQMRGGGPQRILHLVEVDQRR